MSVHLFQQWITDIYRYTCTGYAYIIYKKVTYRQRVAQSTSQTDICLAMHISSTGLGLYYFWLGMF